MRGDPYLLRLAALIIFLPIMRGYRRFLADHAFTRFNAKNAPYDTVRQIKSQTMCSQQNGIICQRPEETFYRKLMLIMATRNVVLTPHQEQIIQDLVQSGRYQNASEVMREGLRLLEQRVAEDTAKLEALRQATQIGLMDIEHGRFTELNEGNLEHYLEGLSLEATPLASEKH